MKNAHEVEFALRTRLPLAAEEVFAWHTRPGALRRLTPPWERVEVVRAGAIADGERSELRVGVGPLRRRWLAEHHGVVAGREFSDVQIAGPFARWEHRHRCEPAGAAASVLEDRVTYELPLGAAGRAVGGAWVGRKVARMFTYRHEVTAADLERHAAAGGRRLRVAVSGATGLVGSALVAFLGAGGHEVVRLVRGAPGRGLDGSGAVADVAWDPARGTIDAAALEGLDAIIHLAGENIGAGRWSAARKERILRSRVDGTRLVAETIARLARPPGVLVSASAVGWYGAARDGVLDESSAPGDDFLARVCREWEAAASPAAAAGVRVVHPRLGVVLDASGGALARMLPPFRAGVGGPVGSGRQPLSWIALDDVLGALLALVLDEGFVGPVDVVAPEPVSSAELARTLGRVLHRPARMRVPAAAVKLLFGEMGEALLLAGSTVAPRRLERAGFRFRYPTLDAALRHTLGRTVAAPPLAPTVGPLGGPSR